MEHSHTTDSIRENPIPVVQVAVPIDCQIPGSDAQLSSDSQRNIHVFVCVICGEVFPKKVDLGQHLQSVHPCTLTGEQGIDSCMQNAANPTDNIKTEHSPIQRLDTFHNEEYLKLHKQNVHLPAGGYDMSGLLAVPRFPMLPLGPIDRPLSENIGTCQGSSPTKSPGTPSTASGYFTCQFPGCDKVFTLATNCRRHERIKHKYFRRGDNR